MAAIDAGFRERVYRVVRLIPRGRVATYGDVAYLAGAPRHARHVGWALRTLPPGLSWGSAARAAAPATAESGQQRQRPEHPRGSAGPAAAPVDAPQPSTALLVPWHRVVNAQGRISRHPDPEGRPRQIALLRGEGLVVADDGALTGGLAMHAWWPEPALLETIHGEQPE